jgi:hypothetical protein
LAADPAVGVDARIHLGTIQFLIGKVQESVLTLQQAAGEARSDFERNFAWLMAGFALETLQRTDDALLAFENAVRAMPSARTSALALATRLALKGSRVEAEGVAAQALTSRDSPEPWLYPVAVYGVHETTSPSFVPDQSVQDVRGMAGRLAKVDRIRVIAATTEVHEVARMQAVTPELPLGSLEQIPVARVTSALNDAIALALLHQSPSDRRHVVVVFSDGIDGASVTDEGVLLKLAAQSDAILFYVRRDPMGLFGERNRSRMAAMQTSQQLWPTNARVFEDIAHSTGGAVRDQPINASMVPAFNDILLNLRERYVLWYAPENVKPGWHKTTVKVQRDGNYKLDARQGYFAR